jgi:hypothetical protein
MPPPYPPPRAGEGREGAGLVPATPSFKAQSENDRGGRDKSAFTRVFNALLPGHDARRDGGRFNLTGTRRK